MQLPPAPEQPRPRRARGPNPTSCDACRSAKVKCRRPKADETGGVQVECEGCKSKGIECVSTTNRRSTLSRHSSSTRPAPKRAIKAPQKAPEPDVPVLTAKKSVPSPSSNPTFPSFPSSLPPSFSSLSSPSAFRFNASSLTHFGMPLPAQRPAFSSSSSRDTSTAYPSYPSFSSNTVPPSRLSSFSTSAAPSSFSRVSSSASRSPYPNHHNTFFSTDSSAMPLPSLSPSTSASSASSASSYAVSPPSPFDLNAYLASQPFNGITGSTSFPSATSGYTFPSAPRTLVQDDGRGVDEFPSSRRKSLAPNGMVGFAAPAPGSTFSSSYAPPSSYPPAFPATSRYASRPTPASTPYGSYPSLPGESEQKTHFGWTGQGERTSC